MTVGGALLVVVGLVAADGSGDLSDVWVLAFLGVLCLAVGGLLRVPLPAAVTLLAAPVALFALMVALFLLAGGWMWSPLRAGIVDAVIVSAVALLMLEVVSVAAGWRSRMLIRRKKEDPPAGSGEPVEAVHVKRRQEDSIQDPHNPPRRKGDGEIVVDR
jgi:uncharacterized protein (DUF58 family)